MLVAAAFTISGFLFGIFISNHLKFLDDWWKKGAFALGLGILVSTWLVFILSWCLGSLSEFSILLSSLVLLLIFAKYYRHQRLKLAGDIWGLAFCLCVLAFLIYLNARLLPHMDGGNMIAGGNIWGDAPFHLGVIHSFSEKANYPPKYPILQNASLAYPFLIDFLSAIYLKGGLMLSDSLILPHVIFYFTMVSFLYFLGAHFGRRRWAGAFLILLFLFNGNFGAYYALKDAAASPDPMNFLMHPAKAYSHIDPPGVPYGFSLHEGLDRIEFMNLLYSFFLPQRSSIMGLGLLLVLLLLLLEAISKRSRQNLFIAGSLLGLLPLVHAHSFLMASGLAATAFSYAFLIANDRRRLTCDLAYFIIPCLALALPQLLFMQSQIEGAEYFKYRFGWMQPSGASIPELAVYWLRNFGVILPLAIIGFFLSSREMRLMALPCFLLFLLGNLFQLAPWDWDTNKVFIAFFLFLCYFAGIALDALVSLGRRRSNAGEPIFVALGRRLLIPIALLLLIFATFSGVLTLIYWHGDRPTLYSSADFEIAEWIRENTDPDAVWLTSDAHAHVVPGLTGRQAVMGLRWYLFSHGLEARKRPIERDVQSFFADPTCAVPRKYRASYLFLGPSEKAIFSAESRLFEANSAFVKVYESSAGPVIAIYRIDC